MMTTEQLRDASATDQPAMRHRAGESRGLRLVDSNPSDAAAAGVRAVPMSQADPKAGHPLGRFLRTESGSAGLLLLAVGAALAWASAAPASYVDAWQAPIRVGFARWSGSASLRSLIDEGLMSVFFLIVGLEARRELDLGELRDRRRLMLPIVVGAAGVVLPVGLYLVVTGLIGAGGGVHGWGAAMSTDTALSLGVLTVLGRNMPASTRTFLLTALVVDDIVSLGTIATAYTEDISPEPIALAVVSLLALVASSRASYRRRQTAYVVFGLTLWASLAAAHLDPVIAGLLVGLVTSAHTPTRRALEEATAMVRQFREQPGPALARSAQTRLAASLSVNTQLQYGLHPLTSRIIVPVFALANAGVPLSRASLAHAAASPIAIGIVVAYLIGKPVAALVASWAVDRLTRGAAGPQVGYGAVLGGGVVAGVGLTVSLLIASLAFTGTDLQDAKLGILATALTAVVASAATFMAINALPEGLRLRALHGRGQAVRDLTDPVDGSLDHVRGAADAVVTVVEYGDFECRWTAMANPTAAELLAGNPDVRYVWRHFPLTDVHPDAEVAAQAAEAAGAQGTFWEMQELLLEHQDACRASGWSSMPRR